jgi:bisphosphoglycerate-independent phosphoglycerate mutase (AlkP superfamily)
MNIPLDMAMNQFCNTDIHMAQIAVNGDRRAFLQVAVESDPSINNVKKMNGLLFCIHRPCLARFIFSFFTNLSRSSAKQLASAAAYQFSCFSEYTKSSQQAEAAFHQLIR